MPFNPGRFPRQPVGIWWRPARLPVVLVGPGPRPTVQVSRFATPSRLLFQSPELNTSTVQRGPTLLQGLAPDSASEVEVRPDPVILDELLGESADPSRIVVETFGVLGEQSTAFGVDPAERQVVRQPAHLGCVIRVRASFAKEVLEHVGRGLVLHTNGG